MEEQLNKLNLTYEFIPAVDGRSLTEEQMAEMCNMDVVNQWSELLTPGMIGCSLSHYNVYQRMIQDQISYAFILEDDALLSDEVPLIIEGIEEKMKKKELDADQPVLLYYQSKEIVKFGNQQCVKLSNNSAAYLPVDLWRPITTAAYVISIECAKRLVKLIYPIRYSPDSWAVYHRENAIGGIRCVLPLPVKSGIFKSDIGYSMNKPVNRFVKYLEQKNVFPIVQLLKRRRKKLAKKQNRFEVGNYDLNWTVKKLS